MRDICNIEKVVNDNWSQDMKWSTTDLFAPTCQFAPEKHISENLSFDDYCENYRQYFLKQKNSGMVTIKTPMAYWRTLYIRDVKYKTAKESYEKAAKKYFKAKKKNPAAELELPRNLDDYMLRVLLSAANEESFVIQIHTGIQEGMRHDLEDSNPMLLKNLFAQYPDLTFDLFHMGYPYERELIVLAKTHPNVYIDMCWAHIISPFASRAAFYEMLDVLPYTKIFGFGGDYMFFDGVAGHLTLAKQNICAVLSQKVCSGECGIDLAEKILQAVLHDNAKRVFKL
jgi:predicted TIM-barrel fold metal-dependent hydrolase